MLRSAAAAAALALTACASTGSYVWVSDYVDPAPAGEYVIGRGDVIWIRVFNQDGTSARGKVRADGRITIPFLDDVSAAGYTPHVLAQQIQTRLRDFINAPQVTVSVEEPSPLGIAVLGEVVKTGVVTIEPGAGVLQALAAAGGLNEFAHGDRIFVLRPEPAARVRFDFADLSQGKKPALGFRLKPNDVVIVE